MPLVADLVYLVALVLLSPRLLFRRRGLAAKLFGPGRLFVHDGRPVAWFHGVSVGEVHLLGGVVAAFRERRPGWRVVVSSTTDAGLIEARKRFADDAVFPWPFDLSWAVGRALKCVDPTLVVLAESELWPNFLRLARRRGVPVVVVNGRLSPRSGRRYRRVAWLARRLLFGRVSAFAMSSPTYADNLVALGVPRGRVTATGNVKYDNTTGDRRHPRTRALADLFAVGRSDLVWLAGSTHAPEERIVLDVFRRLRMTFPTLRLVLAPRSPERFDEVAKLAEAAGVPVARRSRLTEPRAAAVAVLDTIGDLGAAWGLADVGFTGGSLDGRRGGQSMIEPAALGVPVLFGPHTWNFRDAVAGLLEVGAALRVADEEGLERELRRLLGDMGRRRAMGEAGRGFVKSQQGAVSRTLDVIDGVLTAARRHAA